MNDLVLDSNTVLDNIYECEDLLLQIADINAKIEHLMGLKKYRTEALNSEIQKLKEKEECFRTVILNTIQKHDPKTKSHDFRPVGSVTCRNNKASYEIEDEDQVLAAFEEMGRKADVIVVKESLDKRKAKALIEELASKGVSVPGTVLKPASVSLSISYGVPDEDTPKAVTKTSPKVVSKKDEKEAQLEDLDKLEGLEL